MILQGRSPKSFVLIFSTGDEVSRELLRFAKEHRVTAAHFTAIGGFRQATIGYFDWEKRDYLKIPVKEQVEVLSMVGDIALEKGEAKIHAHTVLGHRDGSVVGGHLMEGHVRPTLELVLEESPAELRREFDEESGLPLIRIDN